MTSSGPPSSSLPRRLRDGLERVAAVLRAEGWTALDKAPINPTQAQILRFLVSRGETGARVNAVAAHLAVSQPTATDSIGALEKKGLALRQPDPTDRRAIVVGATLEGVAMAESISAKSSATERALEALGESAQADMLDLLIKLIRNLQVEGAVAPQRDCVDCRFFRARAHADPSAPHHCDFVDAALRPVDLRLDCPEHEAAPSPLREKNWEIFAGG